MASTAQPLLDLRAKIGNAARDFEEFGEHPLDSLEGLLGINHAAPAPAPAPLPPQWQAANRVAVQQNQMTPQPSQDAAARAAQDAELKRKFAAMSAARQSGSM